MPTNRKRTTRTPGMRDLSESFRTLFETDEKTDIDAFLLAGDNERLGTTWAKYRDEILSTWTRKNPCRRPWAFWRFDSTEPRRRIGGKGIADFEKYPAILPYYRFGLPVYFADVDPADLPTFESEAAYLQRHDLLTATEKRWLKNHPEALVPEKIDGRISNGAAKSEVFE